MTRLYATILGILTLTASAWPLAINDQEIGSSKMIPSADVDPRGRDTIAVGDTAVSFSDWNGDCP